MRILNFTLPIPMQVLAASGGEYGEKDMSRANKSDAGDDYLGNKSLIAGYPMPAI
jgi:hypothetical protein